MINNMILNAIGNSEKQHTIIAYFKSGRTVTYTVNILEMLKTDPAIMDIVDGETGEIIYTRD